MFYLIWLFWLLLKWNLKVVLICSFLMTVDDKHFLSYSASLVSSFQHSLSLDLYPIAWWSFFFFSAFFTHILNVCILSDEWLLKIFSHLYPALLFEWQCLLLYSFMRRHLLIVLNVFLFRKSLPVPLSSLSLLQIKYIWRQVDIFDWFGVKFLQDDKSGSICILLHTAIQFVEYYLLKMRSFSRMYFWLL